jgi:hypothetical protein
MKDQYKQISFTIEDGDVKSVFYGDEEFVRKVNQTPEQQAIIELSERLERLERMLVNGNTDKVGEIILCKTKHEVPFVDGACYNAFDGEVLRPCRYSASADSFKSLDYNITWKWDGEEYTNEYDSLYNKFYPIASEPIRLKEK